MTEEQIIDDWFDRDVNTEKLPTIEYDDPLYDFVRTSAPLRVVGYNNFYNVNGVWQKIKRGSLNPESKSKEDPFKKYEDAQSFIDELIKNTPHTNYEMKGEKVKSNITDQVYDYELIIKIKNENKYR